MPANWRNIAQFSAAAVALIATVSLTSSALADGLPQAPSPFDPLNPNAHPGLGNWNFGMIWEASLDGLDPLPYSPFQLGSMQYGTHTLGDDLGEGGALRDVTGWRTQGGMVNSSWTMQWDCVVNPDPFVDATINVTNTTDFTQTFWVYMPLNLFPVIVDPTTISGSVSAVLQASSFLGATLGATAVEPVYQAEVDGINQLGAAQLWTPGYSLNAGPFGVANDNGSFVNLAGPNGASQIALRLKFTLSAHDSASVTGIFSIQAVPAPAGLALLGLAGVIGGRRRRS